MGFIHNNNITTDTSEITCRYEAPDGLRQYLFSILFKYGMSYRRIRSIVCLATRQGENRSNWGENDFMKDEIAGLIEWSKWYYIYTLIEDFYKELNEDDKKDFEDRINEYFRENGLGWKMEKGEISVRGNDIFENNVNQVKHTLIEKDLMTSSNEIQQALSDLSKRPNPDISGAIQHSSAALECTCRDITGAYSDTLGKLISHFSNLVPKPLDDAISKMWGYASNYGRHLKEGNSPSYEEAELVVHLSAVLCIYLCKKHK